MPQVLGVSLLIREDLVEGLQDQAVLVRAVDSCDVGPGSDRHISFIEAEGVKSLPDLLQVLVVQVNQQENAQLRESVMR